MLNSHIHFPNNTIQGLTQFLIPPKSSDVQRYTIRGLLFSGIKTDTFISLLCSPRPQLVEIFLPSTELKRPTQFLEQKEKLLQAK